MNVGLNEVDDESDILIILNSPVSGGSFSKIYCIEVLSRNPLYCANMVFITQKKSGTILVFNLI